MVSYFSQGEVWKKFRSTVNPILLQPKTIKLYSSTLNEVAEDMVKRYMHTIYYNNNITKKVIIFLNIFKKIYNYKLLFFIYKLYKIQVSYQVEYFF